MFTRVVKMLAGEAGARAARTAPPAAAARSIVFDGFELVEPGLAYVPQWRPEWPGTDNSRWLLGGVGRKP